MTNRLHAFLKTRAGKLAVIAALGGCAYAAASVYAKPAKKARARVAGEIADDGKALVVVAPVKKRAGSGGMAALRRVVAQLRAIGGANLLTMALLAILRTALSNQMAHLQGYLFRAAFMRDAPRFWRLLARNVALGAASSAVDATAKYAAARLALAWRVHLTRRLHGVYCGGLTYYVMSHVDRRVPDPEHRLCEDLPKFVGGLADLAGDCLPAACDAVFYTARMVSYTGTVAYPASMLAYVAAAGVAAAALSPPFGKLYARRQQLAGAYASLHARLRAQAEPVAFYGGVHREASLLRSAYASLSHHLGCLQRTQWHYGMFQDFALKYFGATFAVVLIIGPFFGGRMRPVEATASARAKMLSDMRYHTGVIISLFGAIGTLGAAHSRLLKVRSH